jgi:hypothetical protein
MRIKIELSEFGTSKGKHILFDAEEIGLRYVENSMGRVFDTIDEQLFFLMVIKHGITFTRLD